MDKLSNDQYNKKIDNELKKKELEKKYGAYFSQSDNIPPELENEWLNNIEEFEQQFIKGEKITVWEYIGKPEYRKADEIDPDNITDVLEKIMDLMSDHYISLHTLCEVDEKELYRFITEELFFHQVDNIKIEGMLTCFTYEEFHPNAEYDIRQAFDYFFRMTMAKMENIGGEGYDMLYIDTKNYTDSKGEKIDEKEVTKRINNFLGSFDYFEITLNDITNISINKDKTDAELTFVIKYKGCFNNSAEYVSKEGNGYFKLKPSEYGGWDIYCIDMPGLNL